MLFMVYALAALCIFMSCLALFWVFRARNFQLQLKSLQNKFKDNPSYETQQFMADLLRGDVLFHIERVAPESVFIRRD
jgi:hypothetical protein